MKLEGVCSFCGGDATLAPSAALRVCVPCAKRIATVATHTVSRDGASTIWALVPPLVGRAEPRPVAPSDIDVDAVFAAFRAGVEKQVGADAATHIDLSEAYRDMGLYVDALREAAVAVMLAVEPRSAARALDILLAPPLLLRRGLARLRAVLRAS